MGAITLGGHMQDLNQDRIYSSSREGDIEVRWMVVTHAQRALDKLIKDHGPEVVETPLGKALRSRASIVAEATGVDSIDGGSKMLRSVDGKFAGAYVKKTGRKP